MSKNAKNSSPKRDARQNTAHKGKHIPLTVKLVDTGEIFAIRDATSSMKIRELKAYLEFSTGIPVSLQTLHYLDEADLQDNSDIKSNDIVAGGQLHMRVWHSWISLIKAVAHNDINQVLKLGVVNDPNLPNISPAYNYMSKSQKQQWITDRASIALFVSCHRGHQKLVATLISAGADVNMKTSLGRTPLHVAAAQGQGEIVDSLLNNGADVNEVDKEGESALAIAERFGNKDGARHLFLFRWQVRAAQAQKCPEVPLYFHQQCDTANPVWLAGDTGQVYFAAKEVNNEEYSGTSFGSDKTIPKPKDVAPENRTKQKIDFESWLAEKEKKEEGDLNKIREAKLVKKLEEEKRKEQNLIDKESFETWVKKQQEQKERQALLKKAKGKALKQAKEAQKVAAAGGVSVRSSDNFEVAQEPDDNQIGDLQAFIKQPKALSTRADSKTAIITDGNLIYQNDEAVFDKVKAIQAKRAAEKRNLPYIPS